MLSRRVLSDNKRTTICASFLSSNTICVPVSSTQRSNAGRIFEPSRRLCSNELINLVLDYMLFQQSQ
ncbi:hypothetical protein KCU90_g63, partial [Aureobasidium melanogenum]